MHISIKFAVFCLLLNFSGIASVCYITCYNTRVSYFQPESTKLSSPFALFIVLRKFTFIFVS